MYSSAPLTLLLLPAALATIEIAAGGVGGALILSATQVLVAYRSHYLISSNFSGFFLATQLKIAVFMVL